MTEQRKESLEPDVALRRPVASRFKGKVALVVGAGTPSDVGTETAPVGAAIGRLLAWEGCRVAVLGQSADPATETARLIREDGGEAISLWGDASIEDECRRAVSTVVSTYGAFDILVNNLGVVPGRSKVTDTSEEEWDRILGVNAKGLMLMAKHSIPHLRPGGAIVNISSVGAMRHRPGMPISYAASKAAVNSLTITLAVELAHQAIRVNCVSVGNVWTPRILRRLRQEHPNEIDRFREVRRMMNPLQIEGTGWDIAHAVAFLASDEARWITGEILSVDGGAMLVGPSEKAP